jgi:soluble lytic murein transglycosylase-like protein
MRALKLIALAALLVPGAALAGAQAEEPLSASVQASLQKAVSDRAVPHLALAADADARKWTAAMSQRLAQRMPDESVRLDFLRTVRYEATRAGLDPELVLALIQVESAFRKYAVSTAGARGFMQVMPFWVTAIGNADHNLFHLRTNLRYGCTILRHYLDIERGNLFRALGRYNGSLGQAEYPNLVLRAWGNWQPPSTRTVEFKPVPRPAPLTP